MQPPDVWRVNACSRFQADRYDFCWQFYDCSFISHASFRLDECDMAGKTFVDLGSGVGQVLLRSHRIHLNCNRVGRISHYTGTSQFHVTGLHDGCSAVQCIQVYAPYFYSLNHYLMCPLLQMFWNRNNGPSSPVCSAAAVPVCEPSSFFFFCILSFHISLNFTHVQLQIPVMRKRKWRCPCSSPAPARRLLEELRCQRCHFQRRARVHEQSQIWT